MMVVAGCAVAGCGSGASHALYSTTNPWGMSTDRDPLGKVLALTSIPLCTKGHTAVTLTSIEPVALSGQIHLDRILVKRGLWGELAIYPGAPPGSRRVAGFVIPAPAPCKWPDRTEPLYEAIVLAHRTGPRGGSINSLLVHYRAGHIKGSYTIPVTYELCGKHRPQAHCQDR